jgi:hypothetical protein
MTPDEAIRVFFDAFVQRRDTYSIQEEKGYFRTAEEITAPTIISHWNGEKTIGVYQFSKDNKLKWICFDYDGEKLEEQLAKAKVLYERLKEKGYSPLLEFSGKKGYHIWIFCEETDGASAKYWAEEISAIPGYEANEIFPKQEKIDDGFGNLVKLPLGVHRISGKRSVFFNEEYQELSGLQAIEFLAEKIKQKAIIPKVIVRETIRTIIKPPTKLPMPGYIQHLINTGAPEGNRHETVFIITKELFNNGFPKEEIIENALQFNQNCKQPKPAYIITNHVNYLLQYSEKYLAKESTQQLTAQELKDIEKVSHAKVIAVYKKWFYLKNEMAIDLALAVAISRKEKMQPLWIIMIAASGSGKSELIRPFADETQPSTTEIMSKITPNTFLSGVSKAKIPHTDFGETLEGNPKLFLTYDFAQFVKLDSEQKGQIWAQLRDLYDGFLERKAFDTNKKIDNLKVNWLICSTPIVDSELLVHQELGTRELIFRFDPKETEKKALMKTIWENSEKLGEMRKELKQITRAFIEKRESEGFRKIEISAETREELENLALMIATLRAATESDNYTGELTNFVYEEMPTRILLQLKDLFVSLKNLDEEYPTEKVLDILKKIALSSIHPIRLQIVLELMKFEQLTTTELQKHLSIAWKTVLTQLYTAKQLGLVDFLELDEGEEGQARAWKKKQWYLTKHPVAQYIRDWGLA